MARYNARYKIHKKEIFCILSARNTANGKEQYWMYSTRLQSSNNSRVIDTELQALVYKEYYTIIKRVQFKLHIVLWQFRNNIGNKIYEPYL